MQRILLTGATGYIGSSICKALLKEGAEVHVLIRAGSKLDLLTSHLNEIKFYTYNNILESAIDAVKKAKPDGVIHIASLFIAEHSPEQIDSLIASNITFGTLLLEALSLYSNAWFLNAGTSWQHLQDEPYNPACLYAATKEAFEKIIQFYVEARRLRAITLKIFDTYGPRDPRKKLINIIKQAIDHGEILDMSGGDQVLDITHIDDIVSGFLIGKKLLEDCPDPRYQEYAFSSENRATVKEIASLMENISGKKLLANWGAIPYRKRELMTPWSHGKSIPGWLPSYSLKEGIKTLWN